MGIFPVLSQDPVRKFVCAPIYILTHHIGGASPEGVVHVMEQNFIPSTPSAEQIVHDPEINISTSDDMLIDGLKNDSRFIASNEFGKRLMWLKLKDMKLRLVHDTPYRGDADVSSSISRTTLKYAPFSITVVGVIQKKTARLRPDAGYQGPIMLNTVLRQLQDIHGSFHLIEPPSDPWRALWRKGLHQLQLFLEKHSSNAIGSPVPYIGLIDTKRAKLIVGQDWFEVRTCTSTSKTHLSTALTG